MNNRNYSSSDKERTFNVSKESLTPEEKAVFLRCRRTHLMKGRGFAFIHKFPALTYSIGSFVAFIIGVKGAPKCVNQGIMALDYSPLREQILKHRMSVEQRRSRGTIHPPQASDSPIQQPSQNKSEKQYSQSSPPVQARSPEFKDGPSINQHSYNREKAMLDSSPKEFDESNIPDAFDTSNTQAAWPNNQPEKTQPPGGKTFDEIREENRRRQQQSRSNYPTDRPQSYNTSGNTGGTKRKRYNEYGDEIED